MTIASEAKTCLHLETGQERSYTIHDGEKMCLPCAADLYEKTHDIRLAAAAELGRRKPLVERTMTQPEERGWLAAMTRPSVTVAPKRVRMPRKVAPQAEPVVMQPVEPGKWQDVYDYWDAHPRLTLAEAERAVRRLQRAAV